VDLVAHIAGLPLEELVAWAVAGGFGALGVRPWLAHLATRRREDRKHDG
jgi:hypothetical protein